MEMMTKLSSVDDRGLADVQRHARFVAMAKEVGASDNPNSRETL